MIVFINCLSCDEGLIGTQKKVVIIQDFYAKNCGRDYFILIDNNRKYRVYKFSYYWSNVGEAYVLVFSKWLPKEKREKIPFDKNSPKAPKWLSPTIEYGMPWGVDERPLIRKIEKRLRSVGEVNMDKIMMGKGM
ncbi:MAG: hypothetical protein E7515_07415 [Ruminococcaceae bacterium]|jgi:hypothetical protein|nr:hypothetical protein [Oscillospiraceae bacterium]